MMKKIISSFVLLLVLSFVMIPAVFASDGTFDLVTDDAFLLTEEERAELNARAEEISEMYECDIVVITMDSIGDNDAYNTAEQLYDSYNIGYGPNRSCLILLLSMENRDYALVAYGYGNTAFTDYGKDVMLDEHVLPLLGGDEYYEAFSTYYDLADEYLNMAYSGEPFDIQIYSDYSDYDEPVGLGTPIKLAITIIVPILIAFIVCSIWKHQMKTAVIARDAGNYIPKNGFALTRQQDDFLYRTETRRKIEQPSDNSSDGSGGTTVRSSGSSGRSGKF